jgi:hypothetical protein
MQTEEGGAQRGANSSGRRTTTTTRRMREDTCERRRSAHTLREEKERPLTLLEARSPTVANSRELEEEETRDERRRKSA